MAASSDDKSVNPRFFRRWTRGEMLKAETVVLTE